MPSGQKESLPYPPGTVSRILWHFTGGPRWNVTNNTQEQQSKPAIDAYHSLVSILATKELRLGQYHEIVRVSINHDLRGSLFNELEDTFVEKIELRSSQVCCLADIPIAHLSYQAKRYGKMAIGFHRAAAVRHGFNPVFYALHNADALRSIYQSFAKLDDVSAHVLRSVQDDLESGIEGLKCIHGHHVDQNSGNIDTDLEWGDLGDAVKDARHKLERFLAFVKTFTEGEFSTIYCEREWRATTPFKFDPDDVAMIVLPKNADDGSYFSRFFHEGHDAAYKRVPVVPWEDLIEH